MGLRSDFHAILVEILGSPEVYFQAPRQDRMQYPCILYVRSDEAKEFANNSPYFRKRRYQVTHMDRDPDSDVPDKISDLPLSSLSRFYRSDGLNHSVYDVYY